MTPSHFIFVTIPNWPVGPLFHFWEHICFSHAQTYLTIHTQVLQNRALISNSHEGGGSLWCLIQECADGNKVNAQGAMSANDTEVTPRGFRHPRGGGGSVQAGQ